MSLTSVKMSEEVWLSCLTHALSTETEEIMGLLFGDIQVGRIQVIAFQSYDGRQNQLSGPIPLSLVNRSPIIDIDSSPSSSENLSIRHGYFKAESSL
ncbi:hypothetical protein VIGAN_02166900 [Vigna angularis var. angularis]|uniref:JAB1/MPN/MOV34 metalloenzyme domain-containing protein n=1 Tax=Vigna angularis var. angularis TaxID=157739 RepID=A0A0S3REQ7_PHAAN|nr:hypothetical protein VIGAN_02166900 [Vigna angularis var. angularis]